MSGQWIETYTGKKFPFDYVAPSLIDIEDISHALSQTCRYAGHCCDFYSVAEHTVHVYESLQGHPDVVLMAALLHDASEAYLGDITRPLKMCLPDYRVIESRLQSAIYERFGVTIDESTSNIIKAADNSVLRAESAQLMCSRGRLWEFGDANPANIRVECWTPRKGKAQFMARWELVTRRVRGAQGNPRDDAQHRG